MSHLLKLVESVSCKGFVDSRFSRVFTPRGGVIFRQGETGDCLYVVRSGRLRVSRGHGTAEEAILGEVGRGECLGEMALLAGGVRTATAVAIRDSELIRVGRRDFEILGEEHPRTVMEIMRVISERLDRSNRRERMRSPRSCLAVLPAGGHLPLHWFCKHLAQSLADPETEVIGAENIPAILQAELDDPVEATNPRLTAWLNEREEEHGSLVLRGDAELTAWNSHCLRQADVILLVADAATPIDLSSLSARIEALCWLGARPRVELVLVHKSFPCLPARLTGPGPLISRRHHIRENNLADLARVGRILSGRDLTLVLSGGGARGFAQIGVLKALLDLRIPIDRVGGTSMGALIGAHYALYQDFERTRAEMYREFVTKGRLNDYVLPLQSMILGRRYERLLQNLFGDRRIEDLPLSFYCMTCNLTRATAVAHREGPVWKWLSASISIPGMAPPFVYEGELFIDGGLLNNLPVDVAREDGAGYVLAVDVSPEVDLKVTHSFEGRPNVFQVLRTWLPGKKDLDPYPGLFDILMRTTELSSVAKKNQDRLLSDCYLRLPVDEFKIFDWPALDELFDVGYRTAIETLRPVREEIASFLSSPAKSP